MRNLKIFSVLLISIFLVSLVTTIVAAAPFDPVKDMFASWTEGNLSVNIAKYLFLALLTVLIYAVVRTIELFDKVNWAIVAVIAFIIAFLATAYVTPEEIYTMLISYGAMGIVLGGIIPLVILVYFSIEVSKKAGVGGIVIQRVIWVAFIIFLFYKIYSGIVNDVIGWVEAGIYIAIIILSAIWIFAGDKIMRQLFKVEIQQMKDKMIEEVEKEDILKKAKQKEWDLAKDRIQKA